MSPDNSFLRTPGYKDFIIWADTSIRVLLLVKESRRCLSDWWLVQLILIVVRPSNYLIPKLLTISSSVRTQRPLYKL